MRMLLTCDNGHREYQQRPIMYEVKIPDILLITSMYQDIGHEDM